VFEGGIDGIDGDQGPPGPRGKAAKLGIVFARHAQTYNAPVCPRGTVKLWEGYSLLHTVGNNYHYAQDLGSSGSCVKRFSTMPSTACDINQICQHANRNGKSYWLTTTEPIPTMAIASHDASNYISRCSVCEAPANVLAVHSQTDEVPDCPAGYRSMWFGYSFLAHTSEGGDGGGQDLLSAGSCLEDFRASPFIECTGARGTCQFFSNSLSFWMRTLEKNMQFADPQMKALKGRLNSRTDVSRCSVCIRSI
jgi:integrin beta 8